MHHAPQSPHAASAPDQPPVGDPHRRPHVWLALAASALLGACNAPNEYRGRDESVVFSSLRARVALPRRQDDTASRRVRFCPEVGAELLHLRGDYADDTDHPRYSTTAAAALFEPTLRFRGFELRGLVGPAYLDSEVEGAAGTVHGTGFAIAVGLGCSYELSDYFEPYVRFVQVSGPESRIGRFEAGAFAWLTPYLGANIAYGRQTSRIDDEAFLTSGAAHITSEGVAIGMMVRL
ncbi:MAG: hypothetical protein JNL08_04560 [Planctomycetes bacterium]|nr:hypothetical protein [Planctomycetota bacterium]